MTNEQILKKAFKKATKNGWQDKKPRLLKNEEGKLIAYTFYECIIFSHDFAKAFFKDQEKDWTEGLEWSINLQEMVLEKDPIKYLSKFLK